MYDAIADHGVTHLCGAPIVMSTLLNAPDEEKRDFPQRVSFNTAAAPPPEAVLAGMDEAGFDVTHLYGLTETYGPAVVNEWKDEWSGARPAGRAAKKARQGVRYAALEGLAVMDPETHAPVARRRRDHRRGDVPRQRRDEGLSQEPRRHRRRPSRRLVPLRRSRRHAPDGYIQLKDRSKDIIISGGENISSIEVEDALYKHPAVAAAPWSPSPTRNGARRPAPSSSCAPGI
jgi:fatty-acyl-CoA synthase